MKRIIWHWTGGGHKANATDLRHYHIIIEGDGTVIRGRHPISANAQIVRPNDINTYAAHTRGLNTGSIGLALAAMRQANERPFSAGPSPITPAQVEALVRVTADLCREYGISPTRETVLSHAEVQATLGVAQRGKWDITWLPGMTGPRSAVEIGDQLRGRVAAALMPAKPPVPTPAPIPAPQRDPLPGFLAWLASIFTRRT